MKFAVCILLGEIAVGGAACAAGNASTAASYEAQQLACIDHAASRAEADQCRCEVKASFGRPCELPVLDGSVE